MQNNNTENIQQIEVNNKVAKNINKRKNYLLIFLISFFILAVTFLTTLVILWRLLPSSHIYISNYLSQKTNLNVKIGNIQTKWGNWKPRIIINNIYIYDKKDKHKLWFSAKSIDTLLSINTTSFSILKLEPHFHVININNPYILFLQQKKQWITFNQKPSKEPLESLPNWLFKQDKINIKQGDIKFINENQQELKINFNAVLEKPTYTTNNNYLFKANTKFNGVNANLAMVFSPIYKDSSFVGYFKEWQGDGKLNFASNITKDIINQYKDFFAYNKNYEKFFTTFKNVNSANINTSINFKWQKTIINKAELAINIDKLDGKLVNAKYNLMPNLHAKILLTSMHSLNYIGKNTENNQQNISDKTTPNNDNILFSKEQLKFLNTQTMPSTKQYVWQIQSLDWNNNQNKQQPNTNTELSNITFTHPTYELFPFSISIKDVNLAPFVELSNYLPLGEKYQNTINYLYPKAKVNNLQLAYNGQNDLPLLARIAINADIEDLQFNYPQNQEQGKNLSMLGKNGFNINIQGNIQKGDVAIQAKNLIFNLKNMQAKQLNIDNFSSALKWNIDNQIKLETTKLEANNKDINIQAAFTYKKQPNIDAFVESSGKFSVQDFDKIRQFLPNTLDKHVHELVADMNIHAKIEQGKFKFAGFIDQLIENFKQKPKPNNSIFLVDIPLNNATFNIPHKHTIENTTNLILWPKFEQINGHLSINKNNMLINVKSAKTADLNIGQSQINVLSFASYPTIQVKTQTNGKLSSMLDYVNTSPIHTLITKLDFITAGDANLKLELNIPTKDIRNTSVIGEINLADNDVQFIKSLPKFKNIQGNIKFNEHGFNFNNASANFLGEQITVQGNSTNHEINIEGNGILSKKGITDNINTDIEPNLAFSINKFLPYIEGNTSYNAKLNIKDKKIKLDVESNLKGIDINLPSPLNKKAAEDKKLHFTWQIIDTNKNIEKINLNYNNFAGLIIEQQRINGIAKNIRGIYYADNDFTQDIPLPDEGIQAKINLDYINADAWRQFYNSIKGQDTIKTDINSKQDNTIPDYMPSRIAAYTQTLRAMDREIKNIILGLSRQEDGWSGNISSSHINGYLSIKPVSKKYINGLIQGHFAIVNIPNKEQKTIITNLLQEKVQDLPALDIKIDDFSMLEKKLGKINLKTENIYHENYRDWHIKEFSLQNEAAILTASGIWNFNTKLADKNNSYTKINLELKLNDTGEFLNQLGATQVLKKGNGKLQASLEWVGSPVEFNYPSLNSKLNLNLKDGFILKVDPAAAKLLGIVSLQGLGNILTFNWNKLFAQGSPFDEIDSEAYIKNGILTTNHFRLDSPQAKVMVKGEINLMKETQNMQADIFPKINAGSASLAYSLINPAIGLGTLIAQVAFSNPLSKILKQSYKITGKWENPKVKHVSNNDDMDKNSVWQER